MLSCGEGISAGSGTVFRLRADHGGTYAQLRFSGALRTQDWRKKANFEYSGSAAYSSPDFGSDITPGQIVRRDQVIDLSSFVDEGGRLTWEVPAGDWTILRIGHTATGALNRSAPDSGVGLECDKYSKAAIEYHFDTMMKDLLPYLYPLAKEGKVGLLVDSYEVGMQNWTPAFEAAFEKQVGYDLLTYLPAMTGRIVDSVDTTDRFLWDLRRVQADLMADNYYGHFTELCHRHNFISYSEPYDRGPMDELQIGARMDINMGGVLEWSFRYFSEQQHHEVHDQTFCSHRPPQRPESSGRRSFHRGASVGPLAGSLPGGP